MAYHLIINGVSCHATLPSGLTQATIRWLGSLGYKIVPAGRYIFVVPLLDAASNYSLIIVSQNGDRVASVPLLAEFLIVNSARDGGEEPDVDQQYGQYVSWLFICGVHGSGPWPRCVRHSYSDAMQAARKAMPATEAYLRELMPVEELAAIVCAYAYDCDHLESVIEFARCSIKRHDECVACGLMK